MSPYTTESRKLKTTFPRLPFSQSSGWQLSFANWVHKQDRSLFSDVFYCFLLLIKVMKIMGPFHLHCFRKAVQHCASWTSFPVSDHQLLRYLGEILVMMAASWSGFLIPDLVTEVVPDLLISTWSPTFLTFLTGRSVLGVFSGGLAESLPLQPFQWCHKQLLHGIKPYFT